MSDLEQARKQEIRYQVLVALDSERPGFVSEAVLQRACKLQPSQEELRRELLYLKQRGLIEIAGSVEKIASLLAPGVDLLEGNSASLAGLLILDDRLSPTEIERRKEIRWRLLRVADISRPIAISESLAQRALHDVSFVLSQKDVRRCAVYLEQTGLLEISRSHPKDWNFQPTADGVDVCEYVAACPPGVARPEKYW